MELGIRPLQRSSLLSKPIEQLKLEINNEIINKCRENSEKLKNLDKEFEEFKTNTQGEVDLWVEKFKPKDFFELLSDDGINRLVLTWMKSWDYCVFGKEINKDKQKKMNQPDLKGKPQTNPNLSSKKRKRDFLQNDSELEEKLIELDDNNRPKIKVALISGPPGLGKTTMAHVIAKRAGYNFIEMNASDDRSPEAFKQNIESVTQIRGAVNDSNMKPNCLIIDEIDGAPANSIQVLIDHINETVKTKKKGVPSPSINRPIICVCNDLYAPSLKQLRQVAIVFQCPKVTVHRLAERLSSICAINQLDADMDGLIALCDKTNNDIRSSLNTLQFLSKQNKRITSKMINQLTIGQKDHEKSLFTVLGEVFSTGGSNLKTFLNDYSKLKSLDDETIQAATSHFNSILHSCQNVDLDKLTQGIYENYLTMRFRDSNFESVNQANDWFLFVDKLNKQYREHQDYVLYNYQKYLPIFFHVLFANGSSQVQNKRFKYPNINAENYMKLKKNTSVITHMLDEMTPSIRVMYNSVNFMTIDLLPFLSEILHPNLRPVTIQLFSKSEKEKVDNLIKLMILFNLNYRQERGFDGQYTYILEPPIDEIIKFSGLKQRKQLPYILKQQISREVAMEKVKLVDKHKTANSLSSKTHEIFEKSRKENDSKPAQINTNSSPMPSVKKAQSQSQNSPRLYASPLALKAAAMFKKVNKTVENENSENRLFPSNNKKTKETPMNDMFKKFLKPSNSKTSEIQSMKSDFIVEENEEPTYPTSKIWLKYKEGFINAVRYPIKIRQLL